jgi:hypothetical protein
VVCPKPEEFLVGFKFGAGTLQKVTLHFFPRQWLLTLPWKRADETLVCLAYGRKTGRQEKPDAPCFIIPGKWSEVLPPRLASGCFFC